MNFATLKRLARIAFGTVVVSLSLHAQGNPPLTIDRNGVLLKDGKPCHAIGVNFFDAFSRTLVNSNDTSYVEGFEILRQHHIPFIRFMAGGYYAVDWQLYVNNKQEYFRRFDAFVRAAEQKQIGLVPSLFWWDSGVPDLMHEPRSEWGNPNSKTISFMRQYVGDLVSRYKNSPAVWAWELGNEYSLSADIGRPDTRPVVVRDLGTPDHRSAADDLTHDMVVTVCRLFAEEVRKHDAIRPITTGHSLPRPAAYHLHKEGSWTQDSVDEFATNVAQVTPAPMDLVQVHIYTFDKHNRFSQKELGYLAIVTNCLQACARIKKPLYLAEFGCGEGEKEGGPETARKDNLEMLDAIVQSGVPLASYWAFNTRITDPADKMTITTSQRAYLLDAIEKANRTWKSKD